MSATPPKTGIFCPSCHQPVGVAENKLLSTIMMWCPACNHRWVAEEPAPKHSGNAGQ